MTDKPTLSLLHMAINCVVLGMAHNVMYVLLVKRNIDNTSEDYRLPGGLVYNDEDLDMAAGRILHEHTGMTGQPMMQFKAFGPRSQFPQHDIEWLRSTYGVDHKPIVSLGYVAMGRIGRKLNLSKKGTNACWVPLGEALNKKLAFDHNIIITEALQAVRRYADINPAFLFKVLPDKFTALQLRMLYEFVYNKPIDVRNFKKKMDLLAYLEPLDEYEQGVAHRAARYYRFNRIIYKKSRRGSE